MQLLRLVLIPLALFALLGADDSKPADKPPPFDKEIKAFEAADAKEPPPKNAVLFLGSSSIKLWTTLAEDFRGIPVINRGFGGSQIAHSTRYADRIVIPCKPQTIVFYAGDNDIASGKKPEKVLEDYKALVKKLRAGLPDTRILFISIKPSIKRWNFIDQIREANRLIKEFSATDKKLGYIDIFPAMLGSDGKPRAELLREDGLHMTRKGYELWRDTIRPLIEDGAKDSRATPPAP